VSHYSLFSDCFSLVAIYLLKVNVCIESLLRTMVTAFLTLILPSVMALCFNFVLRTVVTAYLTFILRSVLAARLTLVLPSETITYIRSTERQHSSHRSTER